MTRKEIRDQAEIEAIISRALVCRVAMLAEGYPYVVPLCFGYKDNTLYFHTGLKGRKLEILEKNPRACFEMDIDVEVKKADAACKWGVKYQSVIGYGRISIVQDPEERRKGLDVIMAHYGAKGSYSYDEDILRKTNVLRLDVESMTGKKS
ncbi:MAG: pyridoxamine 5'-phosphate oxidase family protein [Deltaproteobacteria bacterium]|nr:pyridoxamine 5'-phosphate oxidase family protein [Deltaproteobacteria bacterium]MBW2137385.1 pyridoxamine 5'-phosphate oxidase family protein [Deltaproteobacteria bacterium]